jgi:hypothetical protein
LDVVRRESEQAAEVRWGGALLLHPINQRKTAAVTKVREAIVRQTGLEVRTLDDFVRRRRLDREVKEAAVAGARLVVVLPRPDNSIGQGTWCDIGQARRLQAAGRLRILVVERSGKLLAHPSQLRLEAFPPAAQTRAQYGRFVPADQ